MGDVVTVTVNRMAAALDPAFYLYAGMPADTDALPPVLFSADDDIPEPPGLEGPFSDPQMLDFIIPSTGTYTVAVWDFLSAEPGPLPYSITLDAFVVPEPSLLTLLGLGLVFVGRRRLLQRQ